MAVTNEPANEVIFPMLRMTNLKQALTNLHCMNDEAQET